ncbi:MAG: hypothetical protein M1376_10340 [Planctomycetes bacterium]|nr:hypothetical protein [Planctomycetota bacterium]
MPNLIRTPAILEALLRPRLAPHDPPDLSQAPPEKALRLKSLCAEMAARILEETDDARFGDIDGLIGEAAALACELGFPEPPVEPINYDRTADYEHAPRKARVSPYHEGPRETPASACFGWGEEPTDWPTYRYNRPEFLYIFGYRFHDPDRGNGPIEMHLSACVETTDSDKPALHDPWEQASKTEYRSEAVKYLSRWVRFIDSSLATQRPATGPEESKEPRSKPTPDDGSKPTDELDGEAHAMDPLSNGKTETAAGRSRDLSAAAPATNEQSDPFLPASDLAVRLKVDYDALRRCLERRRRQDDTCSMEVNLRRRNEPQFLYRFSVASEIAREILARQKRPANVQRQKKRS